MRFADGSVRNVPTQVLSVLLLAAIATAEAKEPLDKSGKPVSAPSRAIGHRGLIHQAPENTLAGFAACIELRIGFELDVQRTRDGHLVCIHDDTVDRTTNGKGKVSDLTLAEIQALDAGQWFDPAFQGERVPTVEEAFVLLRRKHPVEVLVAVDFKCDDEAVEADVVRLAVKHQVLGQLVCIGRAISIPAVRRRLRAADPMTSVAAVANTAEELAGAIADRDSDWVYARFLLGADQVKEIRDAGKRIFSAGPLVIDRKPDNWQALIDVGVDAILTDHPFACQTLWRNAKGSKSRMSANRRAVEKQRDNRLILSRRLH